MTASKISETGIRLIDRARLHGERVAVLSRGTPYTYNDLLRSSKAVASGLLLEGRGQDSAGNLDLKEERVAYLVPGSFQYVAVQWGVWRAGGMAVPLSMGAREPELEHVLTDAGVSAVLVSYEAEARVASLCHRLGIPLRSVEEVLGSSGVALSPDSASQDHQEGSLPTLSPGRRAMMLYTSGTTSKPKGVVSTHGNIEAQITSLVEAWGWQAEDRIPLFLPLHHIHGIVNVLSCALWSGAQVETFPSFDLDPILRRVGAGAYSVFMAVPTIYVKLIEAFEAASPRERSLWKEGFGSMRLMISGSAALPAAIHERWTDLTGQKLLERYGMTEIGMGLSNPLHGERRPGAVGQPLPAVDLRLVDEGGEVVGREDTPGEIQVRGPGVFTEYWRLPEVTAAAFQDGWFRTGDMAVLEDGYYRILGRLSVDIIKSGGYKLSALEIEDVLRQHPRVQECAVVGVDDELWGEAVAVAVKTRDGGDLSLDDLKGWASERLSTYKLPKMVMVVPDFPRNAMGKVMKPAVKDLFQVT